MCPKLGYTPNLAIFNGEHDFLNHDKNQRYIKVSYLVVHPTNRKWISSPQWVDEAYLFHRNNQGYNPLTIRGMRHQVWLFWLIKDSQSPSRTSGSMSHLHGTDEPRAARLVEMRHGVLGVYPSQQVVHDQNITHTHTHAYLSISLHIYIYIIYIYICIHTHIYRCIYIYTRCFLLRMRFYYIKNYQRLFLSMCHICEHRWSCRRACEFLLFLRQKLHHVLGGGRSSESRSVGANKSPFLMGKPTISMAIFYRYVKLLEGNHH